MNVVLEAFRGLVVSRVMFDTSSHLAVLHAVNVVCGQGPAKDRIFTEGFEASAE